MENPATWGPAEKVISKAWTDWTDWTQREGRIGLSLPKTIASALREADLLSDVPLKLADHAENHDGEFRDGCKYCDWEREHNENYPQ